MVVLAFAVGSARAYRGMHHPSDVLFGGLMGVGALAITVLAVRVTSDEPFSAATRCGDAPAPRRDGHLPAVSA